MVLMALDHTRDFVMSGGFNPRDYDQPFLFMTRWVTHICAPTFIFLAGTSLFLWQRSRSREEAARYILIRGLWLVVLEFTLVRLGWTFSLIPGLVLMQVIWVIGISMIILSGLIFLPTWAIAGLSGVLIVGHNMLDAVDPSLFGNFDWLWVILHAPGFLHPVEGVRVLALYSVIPWVGVMGLGYVTGGFLVQELTQRRRTWLMLGGAALLGFVVLRAFFAYGDPAPWVVQEDPLRTILAFIDLEKYPPSLLYLLMTLGLSALLLWLFEGKDGPVTQALGSFGRVPLFFYVVHIFLIHSIALLMAQQSGVETDWLFQDPFFHKPAEYGFGLGVVYMVWVFVVAALYPACIWFGRLKAQHKGSPWTRFV